VLLRQWQKGLLTGVEAAGRLGLSARHFRRLCRRWEAEGDSAVVRREPSRRGNPQYGAEVRAAVLDQAAQPLHRDFGPTLLSEHAPGAVPSWTVRRWMIEAGLWEVRVADVSSMAEANLFLEERFLPFWRRRFRVEPADFTDAHLPLETGTDLLRLLQK
jgi:hypothetical protein